MWEGEVIFGFMVIENEDWSGFEAVFDCGIFEEFREKNFGGGIDNNIAVGFPVEFVFYARPIWKITKVFRDVDWAIERNFWVVFGIKGDKIVEGDGGAKRIAVGVFSLDDTEAFFIFNKINERLIHIGFIIA